jgi:hypothetical protein
MKLPVKRLPDSFDCRGGYFSESSWNKAAISEDYKAAIRLRRHWTDDSSVFSGTIKFLENRDLNSKNHHIARLEIFTINP